MRAHGAAPLLALWCLWACGDSDTPQIDASQPTTDVDASTDEATSGPYADDALWLCKPGIEDDRCRDDITATDVAADGSLQVVKREPTTGHGFDCFYVYPTVDLSLAATNVQDLSDPSLALDPLRSQAAPFASLCDLHAPLYHQATIGAYLDMARDEFLDRAYGDIVEAFDHFLEEVDGDRPFVLMGHSQGTGMLERLIKERLDDDEPLRSRLLSAILIGGGVTVATGDVVGGTFDNIPLCEAEDQVGCVIAYRSFSADDPPLPPAGTDLAPDFPEGTESACTNPANLGGGPTHFDGAYFPTFTNQPLFGEGAKVDGVDTAFVRYREFYTGVCATTETGVPYLQVGVDTTRDDVRDDLTMAMTNAIPIPGFGLHVADWNFAIDDLLRIVKKQAASR